MRTIRSIPNHIGGHIWLIKSNLLHNSGSLYFYLQKIAFWSSIHIENISIFSKVIGSVIRPNFMVKYRQIKVETNFNKIVLHFCRRTTLHQKMAQSDENELQHVADADPNDPPTLIVLDNDCIEEILEYLCMRDLIAFGRTCKKYNIVAGVLFQRNYPNAWAKWHSNRADKIHNGKTKMKNFELYIRKINVECADMKDFNYIGSSFRKLENIQLVKTEVSANKIECIKGKLSTIETVGLIECKFNGDLHGDFLKFCVSLKHLYVLQDVNDNKIAGFGNEWLLHKYPTTLEHFSLILLHCKQPIDELKTFFERNSNIRRISVMANCLWLNRLSIMEASLELDFLEIYCSLQTSFTSLFTNWLNELHEKGVFKKLHLNSIVEVNRTNINQLASLRGLEKLIICCYSQIDGLILSALINIKVLVFGHNCNGNISHIDSVAKNLAKLETIEFAEASLSEILPFIRYSASLKTIIVKQIKNGNLHIEHLMAWDKERQKMTNARKIAIYVNESDYLKIKWASNETMFSSIQIKRYSSCNERF